MDTQTQPLKVGVVGLGRMGGPIALKFKQAACDLMVYDDNPAMRQKFTNMGITVAPTIEVLSEKSSIIWIMVPSPAVDSVLSQLCSCTAQGTVLIDGGNSHFTDTIRRAQKMAERGLAFLDCGTSGGLWGAEHGFSMMIGGDFATYERVKPVFAIIAASPNSYRYVGPSGAGHYVKMVHNGIEYALLEAYAEGFALLHQNKQYPKLDLAALSALWMDGAVIRSWILSLFHDVLTVDQDLDHINGAVGENGTGRWAVEEAHAQKVRVTLIQDAVCIREQSRITGGDYGTKLVAMVRHYMGGHPVAQEACPECQMVQ